MPATPGRAPTAAPELGRLLAGAEVQVASLKARVGDAVTTTKRSSQLPDVPTVAESGIPGYETSNWFALLAPAGTPREVVSRIHASVVAALKQPAVRERYLAQGIEPIGSSPEELGAFLRNEVAKYARVIASAGIKVD
mgnify:CR=1 FL=1